jgi:transmembrane protein EpsG
MSVINSSTYWVSKNLLVAYQDPIKLLRYLLYIAFGIVLSVLVGVRPSNVGADTENYLLFFSEISNNLPLSVDFMRLEPSFKWLVYLCAYLTESPVFFLATVFAIQFFGITGPFAKKSDTLRQVGLLVVLWLSFPAFYSLSLNVLRQGIAFAIVVYAMDQFLRGNRLSSYLMILIATTFHYASAIYTLGFLICGLRFSWRSYAYLWLITVLFAAAGGAIFVNNLVPYVLEAMDISVNFFSYLDNVAHIDYEIGLRWKFMVVGLIPIGITLIAERSKNTLTSETLFFLKLFLAMNSLSMLTVQMPYNDRFALLSWLVLPFFFISFVKDYTFIKRIVMIIGLISAPFMIFYQFLVRQHGIT